MDKGAKRIREALWITHMFPKPEHMWTNKPAKRSIDYANINHMSIAVNVLIVEIGNWFAHRNHGDESMVLFWYADALNLCYFPESVVHHISFVGKGRVCQKVKLHCMSVFVMSLNDRHVKKCFQKLRNGFIWKENEQLQIHMWRWLYFSNQ